MLAGFIGGFFESGVTPILPLYGLALVVPDRRQGVPVHIGRAKRDPVVPGMAQEMQVFGRMNCLEHRIVDRGELRTGPSLRPVRSDNTWSALAARSKQGTIWLKNISCRPWCSTFL